MTIQEAEQIAYADLDALRLRLNELTMEFGQADNARWIGTASRKQLLAELLRLYANNHTEKQSSADGRPPKKTLSLTERFSI